MGKKIENRDGFFKTLHKYHSNESYVKRQEELRSNQIKLEEGDRFALFISAFLVIILPTLLILAIIILVSFLVFGII